MNYKYVTAFALGFLAMIGWNVFLVQRDEAMYKAYYHHKALTEYQRFCASQKQWHPDCAPLE